LHFCNHKKRTGFVPCTAGARHPDLHPNSISVCMEAKDDDASARYNDFYKGIVEADEEQKLLRQPEE
ncbi:MAG: hypothetical protein ACLUJ0_10930, partial [Ruthenibacterium lactatiformans]|uniref:hypothetical protein n=1 Tax=Ruthenibacterium lactatiformans TaxID=1550024 RepID=UPI0026761083